MKKEIIFFFLVFLLMACDGNEAQQSSSSNTNTQVIRRQIRTITLSTGALTATRNTSVTIEPSQESRVAAKVNGQVVSILQREGALVEADAPIVQLDDRDFQSNIANAELAVQSARINLQRARRSSNEGENQATLQLQTAQSNLELARQQFEEGQALLDVGGIARTNLTALEAQYNQALTGVQQAQDGVNRAARAGEEDLALLEVQLAQAERQLQQARDVLADATIKAPFAGEIAELYVEEGEFMGGGTPAFRLISLDNQQGSFAVTPQDATILLENPDIILRYAGNDYLASIIRSSSAPSQTRLVSMTAQLAAPSEGQPNIPAGSVAQLNYQLQLAEGVLAPTGTVSAQGGNNFIFIVENGFTVRRQVSIVAEAGGDIVLTGVEAGTEVVYPLPPDLREGVAVDVIRTSP